MNCPECNASMDYEGGCPSGRHHPAEASGWGCSRCGTFIHEDKWDRLAAQADDMRDEMRERNL